MANTLVGLRYNVVCEELEEGRLKTEEQLFDIFNDLKENHEKFKQNFQILDSSRKPILNFKQFLETAVEEDSKVILKGSGDIEGLSVKEASLEYDLSQVGEFIKYWDMFRDGSCHSCLNHAYEQIGGDMENSCIKRGRENMIWKEYACPDHMAKSQNSQGQPARSLQELMKVISS